MNSRIRALAVAGIILGGCAETQINHPPTAKPATQSNIEQKRPGVIENCSQATRYQECIVEGIAKDCKERSGGNDDKFYTCITKGLALPERREPMQFSVTVSSGEEVLSVRHGEGVAVNVARLEASSVDEKGVVFGFEIEIIPLYNTADKHVIEHSSIKYNFDGSKSGDTWKLNVLEIWNFSVRAVGMGKATVSFQTMESQVAPEQ